MELSSQSLCCPPHAHILENIDGGSLSDLGALAEPIRIGDGHFTPPDRPGHGIVFDRAALAAHAVTAETRRTPRRGFSSADPETSILGAS